jgi:glycerol-3-phosphate dehydrogenase subunit B
MAFDLIIIGAGLSGLFAGCLAARRGKKTLILARGVGATHVGTGTIDVCKGQLDSLISVSNHPYNLVGRKVIQSALSEFQSICDDGGYPMHGELGKNFSLPTAAGGQRQTCLVPETMLAGDLSKPDPFALANLPGFRDFNAALANSSLQSPKSPVVTLPRPHATSHRDSYATDLALLFDLPGYRDDVVAAWKPLLQNAPKRLGLPAILGLEKSLDAKDHLEKQLGVQLFEIPILPPSVPGMRLFNLLRDDFQNHGGRLIIGPTVRGDISDGQASISADMNGRETSYKSDLIFLATGGFLNGGLVAEFNGQIREPVFNLPIEAPTTRSAWTSERFLDPQPYAKFGVAVNKQLQPLNAQAKPIASNLRVIGSILANSDRLSEGSREGIELATAWRAVETVV